MMTWYCSLLLVLAVLITAGCVEEYTPANVTTVQTTLTTAAPVNTPAGTPTPAPEQMAYISNIVCGVGDRSEAAYHCNGNVRIRSGGVYEAVQVFAMYPDNNTFRSGTVSMGGGNAVSSPFVVFPDIKYQGQSPRYFVKMDGIVYPVSWSGDTGVAWSNMPVPPEIR